MNKFIKIFFVMMVVTMIGLTGLASALNNTWNLNDLRGNSYKSFSQSRYNLYHNEDDLCYKGQIMGRYSDGTFRCSWPGGNKDKLNKGDVNVQDNTQSSGQEETPQSDGDETSGGGSSEEDDEAQCENHDNDCKEKEVCEVVEFKVKEKVCQWKGFGRHKFLHCDWEIVTKEKTVCHSEIVCEEDED